MRTHTPQLDGDVLGRLELYADRFADLFKRSDQARWCEVFLRGLIQDGDRKSVEPLVQRIVLPERCASSKDPVQATQHWLNQGKWDCEPIFERYRTMMRRLFRGQPADLVFDDTSFFKQGKHSVGVQRQYCGSLGKRANCQIAVSLHCATPIGHYPLSMRLHLPESWTSDATRLNVARVPEEHRRPKTKHEIALELLDEAIAEGLVGGRVLADAGYGSSAPFRDGLDERGFIYGVGVRKEIVAFDSPPVWDWPKPGSHRRNPRLSAESPRAKSLSGIASDLTLRRCTWREGTKERLSARFARIRVWPAQGWRWGKCADAKPVWFVVEERGQELRYHFSNAPASMSMIELVRLLKNRWPVEQGYQQLKEELGLDHFEGRSWPGFHHHVCMTFLAYGFLQAERLRQLRRAKPLPPKPKKSPGARAHDSLCEACAAEHSAN
jgi:SRSO17 transposase